MDTFLDFLLRRHHIFCWNLYRSIDFHFDSKFVVFSQLKAYVLIRQKLLVLPTIYFLFQLSKKLEAWF